VWLAADGVIVCEAPKPVPGLISAVVSKEGSQDEDDDGIPDAVDILRGAKKAALNGASYKDSYQKLAFPGGDVPRTEGVCTDVIVRSLRNTGLDLQELLHNDIGARPRAYPMVKKLDPYIDHRRVRTLLPYFKAKYSELPTSHEDTASPYLPGDVVFMDTLGDSQPEHLGIISDTLGRSGFPLVINNWTVGTVTREMDLLGRVPVTHRFRVAGRLVLSSEHQGLAGVLRRHHLELPRDSHQVVLVTTPFWKSDGGTLSLWEKKSDKKLEQRGTSHPVRIGGRGLGEGLGLHGVRFRAPGPKKEGDKKAPAGVFQLGTAFGRPAAAPYAGDWPYRATGPRDYWIDDSKSPEYNQWITLERGETLKWSAEKLSMYSLGLVVEHNTSGPQRGAGSAIFLHPWKNQSTPTIGCSAMDKERLLTLLAWLDPQKKPVLVQVAGRVY
jgi:uncharacterized protein YijF (DUF1287 family)/L,D-peptidoglycan transpeptidase YkuD (ErfK/YbiS/YcfS/YnhG family)